MTPKQVITHYGTQLEAADAIGVSKQAISLWKQKKKIPLEYQLEFEIQSSGALLADVPEAIRARAA